eukprot:1142062-Pelagomonas_calceolata.AAC.4
MYQTTCVATCPQAVTQFGREGGQVELQLDTAAAISLANSTWSVKAQYQGFKGGTLLIKPAPSQDGSLPGLAVLDTAMKSGLAPYGAKYEATWQARFAAGACVPYCSQLTILASSSSTSAQTPGFGTLPMEFPCMAAVACISCLGPGTASNGLMPDSFVGKCAVSAVDATQGLQAVRRVLQFKTTRFSYNCFAPQAASFLAIMGNACSRYVAASKLLIYNYKYRRQAFLVQVNIYQPTNCRLGLSLDWVLASGKEGCYPVNSSLLPYTVFFHRRMCLQAGYATLRVQPVPSHS